MTKKRNVAATKCDNIKRATKPGTKWFKKGEAVNIEFGATVQHDTKSCVFVNQEGEIHTLEISKKNAKIRLIDSEDEEKAGEGDSND